MLRALKRIQSFFFLQNKRFCDSDFSKYCRAGKCQDLNFSEYCRHQTKTIQVATRETMSGTFFNTLKNSKQKLAAWGVAGGLFGTWQWFDSRDDGKILSAEELKSRNKKKIGHDNFKSPENQTATQSSSSPNNQKR